jgi:serine protease
MKLKSSMRLTVVSTASFLAVLQTRCAPVQEQAQEGAQEQVYTVSGDREQAILNRPTDEFAPGVVIVKPREDAPTARGATAAVVSQRGFEPDPSLTAGGEIIYRIAPGVRADTPRADLRQRTLDAVRELSERPDVEYAQPDYYLRIMNDLPNDSLFSQQWNYQNHGYGADRQPGGINLPATWVTNKGDSNTVVAVLDTGILPNHPDIAGSPNLTEGHDFISDPFIANDGDGRDADPADPGDAIDPDECAPGDPPRRIESSWHGTHVAGIVGVGKTDNGMGIAGVNWNVKVQAVRVLGKCGGTTIDITEAIRWGAGIHVAGVPDNPTPTKVINMSLGSARPCSPAFQSAINDAVAEGVTVVVAAGNDAMDAARANPAGCNNVITVAASDARGYLSTRYSNYGEKVDIMAPGGDVEQDYDEDGAPDGVLSTVSGGYAYYNGTSMAAPHVAGVAALLLSERPSLTPAEVLDILQANAVPKTSLECPLACGAGGLNAFFGRYLFLSPAYADDVDSSSGSSSIELVVTLRDNGGPVAGTDVRLTPVDPNVASVSPSSSVTDANGQVKATLRGESEGETQINAESPSEENQAFVRVPSVSTGGLVVLAALFLWGSRRRTS